MSEPVEPLVFFTDRDLGKLFPAILSEAGFEVRRHEDHFAHDCPDEDWLAKVGANGWIAVTHDARIRYKPNEKQAVLQHGVRLLVVVGQAPLRVLAENFVATYDEIAAFVRSRPAPWIGKVYRPDAKRGGPGEAGKVSLWIGSE